MRTGLRSVKAALFALALLGCQEEAPRDAVVRPVPGEVQILNTCGLPKVAGQVRDLLIKNGFDVVEVGNGTYWNYDETVIALRNPHWPGKDALAKALHTDHVIPLENPLKMVDATIYIGKDISKVLEHEQP